MQVALPKRWCDVRLNEGVLREPTPDGSRIVVWIPVERDEKFQLWQRIATTKHAEEIEKDVFSSPAYLLLARQRIQGIVGKFFNALFALRHDSRLSQRPPGWTIPDGGNAEQTSERQDGLVLVWAEKPAFVLDQGWLKSHWPTCSHVQQIGLAIFVVFPLPAQEASDESQWASATGCPRAEAEAMLAAARKAADRFQETSALTDLGVMSLTEGDATGAMSRFEEALVIARAIGDRGKECDILGNLGVALLGLHQFERAQEVLETQLAYAREAIDLFAEKNALERLGFAYSRRGIPVRATTFFQDALALARSTGDLIHQSTLLWNLAVEYAQVGQRDQAVTCAHLAIDLKEKTGHPEAQVFRDHLQAYRSGADLSASRRVLAISMAPLGPDTRLLTVRPESVSDPGWLRQASSAAKAAARLVGSKFKMVAREIRAKRLRICADCVHHTGLRCKVCGCFTNLKSRMPHEVCPLGKWTEQ